MEIMWVSYFEQICANVVCFSEEESFSSDSLSDVRNPQTEIRVS